MVLNKQTTKRKTNKQTNKQTKKKNKQINKSYIFLLYPWIEKKSKQKISKKQIFSVLLNFKTHI